MSRTRWNILSFISKDTGIVVEERVKRVWEPELWMPTRKQGLLETAGQPHIWTGLG